MKGRPAGTPKSDDPNKKKRKRVARERDLCDVKIKITEFFVGATRDDIQGHLNLQPRSQDFRAEHILAKVNGSAMATTQPSFDSVVSGAVANGNTTSALVPATQRFYTIQRVNGTGAGGTRGDQSCPTHKHTLEESDRIKKNSVVRWMAKPKKKAPVSDGSFDHDGIVSDIIRGSGKVDCGVWQLHFATSHSYPCIIIILLLVKQLHIAFALFLPLETSLVRLLQVYTNSLSSSLAILQFVSIVCRILTKAQRKRRHITRKLQVMR